MSKGAAERASGYAAGGGLSRERGVCGQAADTSQLLESATQYFPRLTAIPILQA